MLKTKIPPNLIWHSVLRPWCGSAPPIPPSWRTFSMIITSNQERRRWWLAISNVHLNISSSILTLMHLLPWGMICSSDNWRCRQWIKGDIWREPQRFRGWTCLEWIRSLSVETVWFQIVERGRKSLKLVNILPPQIVSSVYYVLVSQDPTKHIQDYAPHPPILGTPWTF